MNGIQIYRGELISDQSFVTASSQSMETKYEMNGGHCLMFGYCCVSQVMDLWEGKE